MTSVGETAALRLAAGAARPVFAAIRDVVRPDISRPALLIAADDLMSKVAGEQRFLLDQSHAALGVPLDLRISVAAASPPVRSTPTTICALAADVAERMSSVVGSAPADGGRFVIVGEPGAGKSMLSISLLLAIAERRMSIPAGHRDHLPVPVRVEAHGWDGNQHQHFSRWLAVQLSTRYGVRPRVAAALVDGEHILPILDALDQMGSSALAAERAQQALTHLNTAPWGRRPVIVVCRTSTMAQIQHNTAAAGLHTATTVSIEPLTCTDSVAYLGDYRDRAQIAPARWAAVTDQIVCEPDGPLATALTTPLTIALTATLLARRDTADIDAAQLAAVGDPMVVRARTLAGIDDPAAIGEVLNASRVSAAIAAIPARASSTTPKYTESEVYTGLTTLARYLEQQNRHERPATGISLDQVWRLAGTRRCLAMHAVLAAVIVTAVITIANLVGGARALPGHYTLAVVFAVMLITLYIADSVPSTSWVRSQIMGLRGTSERFAWRVPGRSRSRRGIRAGAWVFAVLYSCLVVATALVWMAIRAVQPIPFAVLPLIIVFFAIVVGILSVAAGVLAGLSTTGEERFALGQCPRRLIRDDTGFAGVAGTTFGVAFASISAAISVILGQDNHFGSVATEAVADGFATGATVWFVAGLTSTRYLSAALVFRFTRSFPSRPAQFLDWACQAQLLHLHGTTYQFDHETYRRWILAQ